MTSGSDSAAHVSPILHDRNNSQQPSALKDAVPTATDKGFAEPPAISTNLDRNASQSGTVPTPTSPSKSPSFLSRVFHTFLGSPAETTETTAPRGYSNEAPSAAWGRPNEPRPVEHIREAGLGRAAEAGLDEPTATKQVGLDAPFNDGAYQQSVPSTAVAAAESLVDDKAKAHHDTAVAGGQHAPHSPGAICNCLKGSCRFTPTCSILCTTMAHHQRPFCCSQQCLAHSAVVLHPHSLKCSS